MGSKQEAEEAMNTEAGSAAPFRRKPADSRKRRTVCLVVGALILLLVIIIIILAFTVFKAKKPVTTVDSVSLADLDLTFDILRLAVRLNLTLDADVSVRNPNHVGFKYENSSVLLKYRGEDVGDAPIPAGKIGAGQTVPMNISLTIMADRLLTNNQLFTDVRAGTIPLSTFTRISGVCLSSQLHHGNGYMNNSSGSKSKLHMEMAAWTAHVVPKVKVFVFSSPFQGLRLLFSIASMAVNDDSGADFANRCASMALSEEVDCISFALPTVQQTVITSEHQVWSLVGKLITTNPIKFDYM
nr:Harpin-induced 1, putative [Ipomoea batatas]